MRLAEAGSHSIWLCPFSFFFFFLTERAIWFHRARDRGAPTTRDFSNVPRITPDTLTCLCCRWKQSKRHFLTRLADRFCKWFRNFEPCLTELPQICMMPNLAMNRTNTIMQWSLWCRLLLLSQRKLLLDGAMLPVMGKGAFWTQYNAFCHRFACELYRIFLSWYE